MLTMTLMSIDAEIRKLYNDILGELDAEVRMKTVEELTKIKAVSTDLHEALSKLHEAGDDEDAVDRIMRRYGGRISVDDGFLVLRRLPLLKWPIFHLPGDI